MTFVDKMFQVLSVENIKIEIIRTAYGIEKTFFSKIDARVLLLWYLSFCIVPWFTYDFTHLALLLTYTSILAYMARVSPLIIGLMAFGVITEITMLTLVSLAFDGGFAVFTSLLLVTIKLLIISLASVAVFTSLDPERLSDALLKFRVPAKFCFGISYAYRMLPILIEEYHSIFNSFRLRGQRPKKRRAYFFFLTLYYIKICIKAFYPMMLNTAKRVRTTVESLETKGFTYAMNDKLVKDIRLSYMKVTYKDIVFFIVSLALSLGLLFV